MYAELASAAVGLFGGGGGGMSSAPVSQQASTGIFQVGKGNVATQTDTLAPVNGLDPYAGGISRNAPLEINPLIIIGGALAVGIGIILILKKK